MRRVLKYGGTSIESADRIRRAAQTIASLIQGGDQIAVVVSAQGNDTNLLLNAVYSVTDRQVDTQQVYRIAAMGEEKSVLLLTAALRSLGIEAAGFLPNNGDGWPLIVDCDDTAPLAAQKINEERPLELREDESRRLFAARVVPLLRRSGVAVLSGFFGRSTRGDLTTLGRGGSDISAVLVGRLLEADEVTIITDVEGILSADPRLAAEPRLIEEMSVADLELMASRGARVVHPRALRYKPDSCRVRVVDFRRQEALARSGTAVLGTSATTLVARPEPLSMITLVGRELSTRSGILGELAMRLGKADIPIAASIANDAFICLYLRSTDGESAYRLLHEQMVQSAMPLQNVTLRPGVSEIRLRSPEFLQTPGVLAEITAVLARRRINILEMITSLTDIYIYVDQADCNATLKLLRELTENAPSNATPPTAPAR
jgi:aspartate kinase